MSQSVVAIICEYDPFHYGHQRQIQEIRRKIPGAVIVCLMSTCFTQRGLPALFSPSERTRMALNCGADLVFALPTCVSLSSAPGFASGGVRLAKSLGVVTHLSFGAESPLDPLLRVAQLMNHPGDEFQRQLRESLRAGESYPTAQGKAIGACLGASVPQNCWEQPNNMLAIEYLRALEDSGIAPICVNRSGSYHARELINSEAPSAEAVRRAFLDGLFSRAQAFCPSRLPMSPLCKPDSLDKVLLYTLRSQSPEELAAYPDCSEGLENRLYITCRTSLSREELLSHLKTKRYSYTRLSRLITRVMLGLKDNIFPQYAHLLGLRNTEAVREVLGNIRIPVLSRAAELKESGESFLREEKAYDLWALGAGVAAGMLCRQKTVVTDGKHVV